jgi:hypothetical protein
MLTIAWRVVNAFLRRHGTGFYDTIADMDAATLNPVISELQSAFVPDSTTGGRCNKLHPNPRRLPGDG